MAKATIIFQDTPDGGTVNMTIEFDPPIVTAEDAEAATPAQCAATDLLDTFMKARRQDGSITSMRTVVEDSDGEHY